MSDPVEGLCVHGNLISGFCAKCETESFLAAEARLTEPEPEDATEIPFRDPDDAIRYLLGLVGKCGEQYAAAENLSVDLVLGELKETVAGLKRVRGFLAGSFVPLSMDDSDS